MRANARIQREAWAPTNSNRYTTNYLHRENVALGLVPSQRRAQPVALVPPDPINREALQQHQEIYPVHGHGGGTMYNTSYV